MTPDQIQILTALAAMLKTIGTVPFGILAVFLVIGPWGGMFVVVGNIRRNSDAMQIQLAAKNDQILNMIKDQENRFESVVRMYENNVLLVQNYHSLSSDLTSIITLSTRTLESLVGKIDNNHFCPIVRKELGKP